MSSSNSKKGLLDIQHVRVSVAETEIVKDISLKVCAGEVHVLMGKNGSGKSSLINALMGHPRYTVTKGKVLLDRESILEWTPEAKAKAGLFLSMQHLPAIEGVTLAYFLHQAYKALYGGGKAVMDFYREAQEVAKSVGISELLLDRPLHAGLSGGEKKQSEIIQLLMLKPRFAFLDEIDSGVDVDARKKVWKGIEMLRREGTGFLIVTHHTKLPKSVPVHRVHIMEHGELVATGGTELLTHVERRGFDRLSEFA
jgi:Fe-S cluster assembly ATP-binding protein